MRHSSSIGAENGRLCASFTWPRKPTVLPRATIVARSGQGGVIQSTALTAKADPMRGRTPPSLVVLAALTIVALVGCARAPVERGVARAALTPQTVSLRGTPTSLS